MKLHNMILAMLLVLLLVANSTKTSAAPEPVPTLTVAAEFMTKTRCPIYSGNEPVKLQITVKGRRILQDKLLWCVTDYQRQEVDKGSYIIPKGSKPWQTVLTLKKYGPGYFQVHLHLKKADIILPRAGTRPAGYVAYGVMPDIKAIPLTHVDQSRFGAQGTNFIETGRFMKGNFVEPVYPLLGAKWIYLNRRLAELYRKGADAYKPILDQNYFAAKTTYESRAGLCLLVDLSYLPKWLLDAPEGVDKTKLSIHNQQAYPPNDFKLYGEMIAGIAAEQVKRRKALYPKQSRNYYEIHWEPDWHWRGSDEEFIKMYEVAYSAIKKNDPDGMLLGPNYGVLKTGNKLLKRLFAKGLGNYLDGIVFHTYYVPQNQSPEQGGLIQDMREMVGLAQRYLKKDAPLINTEWGLGYFGSTPEKDPKALTDEAAWFLRGHLITLGEGADTTFYFYTADISRKGGGLLYNLTAPHPGCGATHVAPKPVFMAAATATRLLEGTRSLGALNYFGDNVVAYLFQRQNGYVIALWSSDEKKRKISVPVGDKPVTVWNPMGKSTVVKAKNNMAQVAISAMPVFITDITQAWLPLKQNKQIISWEKIKPVMPGSRQVKLLKTVTINPEQVKLTLFRAGHFVSLGRGEAVDIPANLTAGDWLLQVWNEKTGDVIGCKELKVLAPFKLTQLKKSGNIDSFEVSVENLSSAEASGKLALMEDGHSLKHYDLSLKGHETKSYTFAGNLLRNSSRDKTDLNVTFTDRNTVATTLKLKPLKPVLSVIKTIKAPEIDGKLTEWNFELFRTFDQDNNVKVGKNSWQGKNDLSLQMGVQYDAKALYLAVKVRDQQHFQTKSAANSWQEDSIQLGLAVKAEKQGWRNSQKLCFAMNSKQQSLLGYRHEGNNGLKKGKLKQEDIAYRISRVGEVTSYEIAIPWTAFGNGISEPPPAGRIGFGIWVNDRDYHNGSVSERKCLEAYDGMMWFLPEKFSILKLSK